MADEACACSINALLVTVFKKHPGLVHPDSCRYFISTACCLVALDSMSS